MLCLNEGEEKLDNVKVMQLILTEEMVAKFPSSIRQFIMTFLISWTFSLLFKQINIDININKDWPNVIDLTLFAIWGSEHYLCIWGAHYCIFVYIDFVMSEPHDFSLQVNLYRNKTKAALAAEVWFLRKNLRIKVSWLSRNPTETALAVKVWFLATTGDWDSGIEGFSWTSTQWRWRHEVHSE